MSLRDKLNKNPGVVTAFVALGVLIAGYVVVKQTLGSKAHVTEAYYTTDDGATWFKDSVYKEPPFQVDGKEALLAFVFKCNGKEFVGFVGKYTPAYQAIMKKANEARKEGKTPENQELVITGAPAGTLLKKPGDKQWVTQNDPRIGTVAHIVCPDGSEAERVVTDGYLK